MLTAIASINQAIEQGNPSELWKCLKQEPANLKNVEDDSVNRYLEQLVAVKKEKAQVADVKDIFALPGGPGSFLIDPVLLLKAT